MHRPLRWIVPPALALILFWPGLLSWFQKDDFAWLGLYSMIHNWADLLTALFHPEAQGTMRVISERLLFIASYGLFGMNALPPHLLCFATHIANLTLIQMVCARLTGSAGAGFCAAILWTINSNMAFALASVSLFNQLLCAFVFLLALWLLIQFAATDDRRYLIAQWVVYVAGFGVLELNVVYAALATAYALCAARHVLRQTIPLFLPALAYTALHFAITPPIVDGPYRAHWDLSVIPTLGLYWKTALGPIKLINLGIHPSLGRSAMAAALTVGLLAFLFHQAQRKQWPAVFFAAWFMIVLAPLLALRDHFSDYYLTIPAAGLAMWAATGVIAGWRQGTCGKAAVVLLLAIYAGVNVPLARLNVTSVYERSVRIHAMIDSVLRERQLHPNQPLMLTDIDDDLYKSALIHRPFRLYGIEDICIQQHPELNPCPANSRPFSPLPQVTQ